MSSSRKIIASGLLLAAMAFGSGVMAQDQAADPHGAHRLPPGHVPTSDHASGEHGEGAAHAGDEHGTAHATHDPAPINWATFGGMRTDEHGNQVPLPPPFVASVVNFLILLGIMYYAVRTVVNPALADRRAAIEAELGEAQRLRAEAEAMHRKYTEALEGLDDELKGIRAEFTKAGEQEFTRIVADAEVRAERMQKDGEFAIQQELKQLRSDLVREAVEAAVTTAAAAVKTSINTTDQVRLADEYLVNLEKTGTTGAPS